MGFKHAKALYKIPEAAGLLSCSQRQVFILIDTGKLESVKSGRSRFVSAAAVDKYIERLNAEAGHDNERAA